MRIAVIGGGNVGLVSAVLYAYLGNEVTLLEVRPDVVEQVRRGEPPFHEPGLPELLRAVQPRLKATSDPAEALPGAELIVVAVGTPPGTDGRPDTRQLDAAIRDVARHAGPGFAVVAVKSTAPLGFGSYVRDLLAELLLERPGAPEIAVVSLPEFLSEGSALRDFLYPDRIVLGGDDPRAVELVRALYRPIEEQRFDPPAMVPRPPGLERVPFLVMSVASAELTKYAANAFLALKVSFANEMAAVAEAFGADVREVMTAVGLDRRIGPEFLRAGIGWGGSCFPKDTAALAALAAEVGVDLHTVRAAREANVAARTRAVRRLAEELGGLRGRTIALCGLSFKPGTDDLRESPGVEVGRALVEWGARVRAHDPVALDRARDAGLPFELRGRPEELVEGADALLLATEWPEYRQWPWEALRPLFRRPLLLDGRNALDPERMTAAGYRYLGVGFVLEETERGRRAGG